MDDMPIILRGYTEEKIAQNVRNAVMQQVYARHNAKPEVQEVNNRLAVAYQETNRLTQIPVPRDENWQSQRNEIQAEIQELIKKQGQQNMPLQAEIEREAAELTRREILEYRASRATSGGCAAIEELRELIEELQGRIEELEGQVEEAQSAAEEAQSTAEIAQSNAEDAQSAAEELSSRIDGLEE
ncbi:MAG: hypothetical protein LBN00_02085 [Oscillospiraceae bacterium]|jgi:DNA repair exonuclease SbcCD ATPase subunit|nr:hypothetical protein [Oscillospiraceae bacterium]